MTTATATADSTTATIRIDVEQTAMRDLFTRVVANGWGSPTVGGPWSTAGGVAGDYAVNGTQGTHTFATTNTPRHTFTTLVTGADMGITGQVTIAVAALTQPIQPGWMVRYTNASNYYFMEVSLAPGGVATLNLRKNVLGVLSTISSVVLNQTHAAGATWLGRLEVCGTMLKAKAWRSTVTEPGWLLTAVDPDLTTGTAGGARSVLATGNTNGSTVFAYDNFAAYVSQPIRLYRVTSDGVRTEVRNSPVYTEQATAAANTATAVFWDNEAPLDTNVFYELTSNCSTTVETTSNTVSLVSDGDGWIRDPNNPSTNIRITVDPDMFNECVDVDTVVFSGLGQRVYPNAAGIFDVVDSPRPVTVSQTRKNLGSDLRLTSYTLDDVDFLEDLFQPNTVLLLSLPLVYGFGHRSYGTDYITCYDVTQDVLGVDQRVTTRVWNVPFRLSYAPPDTGEGGTGGNGIGGGGATYGDLKDSVLGTTYNTVLLSGETYLQVAQGVGY